MKHSKRSKQQDNDAEIVEKTAENKTEETIIEQGIVVEKGKKSFRQIRTIIERCVIGIFASVMLFLFIQTEIPDSVFAADDEKGIRAKDIIKDNENVKIGLVYSKDEAEWAFDECERLAEKIDSAYDIATEIVTDTEYKADNDYTLTVSVGYTSFFENTYFNEYLRLGENGYEISHLETDDGSTWLVSVLAFNQTSCRSACDRFISYFLSKNRLFNSSGSLYVSVIDEINRNGHTFFDAPDGFSFITVSYPGADAKSIAALNALMDDSKPNLVIFNGNLIGSCTSRAELTDMWTVIASAVNSKAAKFIIVPSTDDETDPSLLTMLYEIVGGLDGYFGFDREEGAYPIFVRGNDGMPYAMLLICDGKCVDTDNFDFAMNKITPVWRSHAELDCTVIMPMLTDKAADIIENDSGEGVKMYGSVGGDIFTVSEKMQALIDIVNPDRYIGYAGNNCVGEIMLDDNTDIKFGLCGSLDFNSAGIGGRFEINNSLRGAFTTKILTNGEISQFKYVFAADLGAVKR